MNVSLINYGMGNLGSVRRALEELGAAVTVASHPANLSNSDRIILPGVGAFAEGMERLAEGGWISALHYEVRERRKPILGICLGMQMLGTSSEEGGHADGLDLVPGRVKRLDKFGCGLRIPHVGWNEVGHQGTACLFDKIPQSTDFYFVHSYAFAAEDSRDVVATTTYEVAITAAIAKGHVFGTQFHPEKSSKAGRQILRNFLDYTEC